MVCHGPDPPENNPHELTPPPRHDLMMNAAMEDSDDENDNIGYEPLPQGPDTAVLSDHDSEDDVESTDNIPANDVPNIESMAVTLTRDVWTAPRPVDPIQMDNERAEQQPFADHSFVVINQKDLYKKRWVNASNYCLKVVMQQRTRLYIHLLDIHCFVLVMQAMANFALPPTSIPEWAQTISEEQWKQTLNDRIEKLRSNNR